MSSLYTKDAEIIRKINEKASLKEWGAGDLNSDRKPPRLAVCQVSVAPRLRYLYLDSLIFLCINFRQ